MTLEDQYLIDGNLTRIQAISVYLGFFLLIVGIVILWASDWGASEILGDIFGSDFSSLGIWGGALVGSGIVLIICLAVIGHMRKPKRTLPLLPSSLHTISTKDEIVHCSYCGASMPRTSALCPECGAPAPKVDERT